MKSHLVACVLWLAPLSALAAAQEELDAPPPSIDVALSHDTGPVAGFF